MLNVPALTNRQFCTSPLFIRIVGRRTPLIMNVGSLAVMLATSPKLSSLPVLLS